MQNRKLHIVYYKDKIRTVYSACRTALLAGAALALLAGCAPSAEDGGGPGASMPAASAAAATPLPSAAPEPEAAAQTPAPQGEALAYDEIRPAVRYGATPTTICEGYFTMSSGGKWGLMRADGTELLPCMAAEPAASCGWHWMWWVDDAGYNGDETHEQYYAALQASGDGELCPGHGGSTEFFFYDLDIPGRDPDTPDLGALRAYVGSDCPGSIQPVREEQWAQYGDLLPVFSAHEAGEPGDPVYPGEPVKNENGGIYWYMGRDGASLLFPGETVRMAGWFFEQELAPVQAADGLWAYVDRQGQFVTDAVYSAVYDTAVDPETYERTSEPRYAAYLQNGRAAVCRDGKWGLLDSAGRECVPCEYDGAAWEGTTLWVKENGSWTRREVP